MKSDGYVDCASHLQNGFYDRVKHLDRAISCLEKVKFKTIVCMGLSGIIFSSPLSIMMNKQLIVVRKKDENTHSCYGMEKNCRAEEIGNYIIVDDLIDTGRTIERIKEAMLCILNARFVGTYLYDGRGEFASHVSTKERELN